MTRVELISIILGSSALALGIVNLVSGDLPSWLRTGLSEREEREACEAALKARIGSFTLTASPDSKRSEWPHIVTFPGLAVCHFARDGTMTINLE
ncbi:MAG TPA: hypothetical protein VGX03_26305 [Candidatus Binatia bacterium]|nr:hypothetical protein [Candidatus Binatia bacterium]